MSDLTIQLVFDALRSGQPIRVKTATRDFTGRVWEIGRSPYDNATTARVVDDEGRVHYFRIERADVDLFHLIEAGSD